MKKLGKKTMWAGWLIVLGMFAFLIFGPSPEQEKPQATQETIIIKKGCAYALSPDPIKKLKELLGNGDGEAADLALEKMLDSRELIEVVNPRLEVKIIDRAMAPIFEIDMGGMKAWILAGCVDVAR